MSEPNGPFIKIAFFLIGATMLVGAIAYLIAIFMGLSIAGPFGLLGLIPFAAIVILVAVVLSQARNKEDQYYSDNVDQ